MTAEGRPGPQQEPQAGHYIVCGANALAHRLILELIEQYRVPVVALVPDRAQDHAPMIEQLPGVAAVLEYGRITDEALGAAWVASAEGIALVSGTDQENIHAALSANGRNPGIRIVLRMFNQRLGEHLTELLPNCAALSGSATAAPAFANGALQRPNTVRVGDRYVYIALDEQLPPERLCVVADRIDPQRLDELRMLPDAGSRAADFIALAYQAGTDWEPGTPLPPPRPRTTATGKVATLQTLTSEPRVAIPWWTRLRRSLLDSARLLTSARLRLILISALAMVLVAAGVLWYYSRDFGWTVYATLLDLAGAAQPDTPGGPPGTGWQHVAQVTITFCGITFVPVATALLVDALASGRRGGPRAPGSGIRDHVVVVGLGNVGTRVAALIHETGVPVVGIERDPQARGIAAARTLGIPVLAGEAPLESQLRRARIQHSRALVAVTTDDAANLEAALEARALRPDVRIVVRLFDDDFAHHVYATLGNVASRSVSYLAAPAFAAALMGREVLGTLSVFRNVLLIAELTADAGSGLVGHSLNEIEDTGSVRVIAVRLARRPEDYQWRYADRTRRLTEGDRIVVAATRSGLARLNSPGFATTAPAESDSRAWPLDIDAEPVISGLTPLTEATAVSMSWGAEARAARPLQLFSWWARASWAVTPFATAVALATVLWLALRALPAAGTWWTVVLGALWVVMAGVLAVRFPLRTGTDRAAAPADRFEQRLAEAYARLGPPPEAAASDDPSAGDDASGGQRR